MNLTINNTGLFIYSEALTLAFLTVCKQLVYVMQLMQVRTRTPGLTIQTPVLFEAPVNI